jgi:hypothetical protein
LVFRATLHRRRLRHHNPTLSIPIPLITMLTPDDTPPSTEAQLADLHVIMEKLASAVTTIQGNQGQLTVVINRLQSDKLAESIGDKPTSAAAVVSSSAAPDITTNATKFGHKLLFPTYDGLEDPLPWLNRCDQFFRVQETPAAGKVFLAAFCMTGEASQWYTLLERNRGTPSWEEFIQLVNKQYGPPLHSNPLGELIQLRREGNPARQQAVRTTAPQQLVGRAHPAAPGRHDH